MQGKCKTKSDVEAIDARLGDDVFWPGVLPDAKSLGASEFLREVGVPANIRGYDYPREAVNMVAANKSIIHSVTKILYPAVAKKFQTTPVRVERAMRHGVEAAAGKIKGVKIGKVEIEPDYLYINLFIPPRYSVSEVISQIKMRTRAMIRKAAISKGLLPENADYKTWCAGYYVSTAQGRSNQEIAEYIRTALADKAALKVLERYNRKFPDDEDSAATRRITFSSACG